MAVSRGTLVYTNEAMEYNLFEKEQRESCDVREERRDGEPREHSEETGVNRVLEQRKREERRERDRERSRAQGAGRKKQS